VIRVVIELWPLGNERRKSTLGEVFIINDGTGTHTVGNYTYRVMKGKGSPHVYKEGVVRGFPRAKLPAYDLLLSVLLNVFGHRNPRVKEALKAHET
jgi:hypothetical protein